MMYTKLKYDKFEKYLSEAKEEKVLRQESYQYIFKFDNGYGASVVKHSGSYGNKQDLWELAVIEFVDKYEWELCYLTEITCNDVAGYLTNDEVLDLLERIKNL